MNRIIKVIPLFILPILLILSPLFDGLNLSSTKTYLAEDENGFIELEHAEDLKYIDQDLSGKFIVTKELDMSELKEWTPLGSEQTPFTGELTGEEKIINMDADYVDEASKGLFKAMTEDAQVDVEVEFLKVKEAVEEETETEDTTEERNEAEVEENSDKDKIEATEVEDEAEEKAEKEETKAEAREEKDDAEAEAEKEDTDKLKKAAPRYLGDNEVEETAPALPPGYNSISFDEVFHQPIGVGTELLSDTELQITPDAKSNMGAVWSKDKLDFTKRFTLDAYMYLGNRGRNAADGLTITFQNDPRMKTNINEVIGANGMGIGAYSQARRNGTDYIRNALSVEVDTYKNSGTFDRIDREIDDVGSGKGHNGHLGVVIPAPNNNNYSGQHSNVTLAQEPISNGEWHKMTVKWNPATSGLTYIFDDYESQTYQINDLESTFGGTEAHWGFTGSTGGSHALNVVAFKELPQHQLISQKASVQNKTENGNHEEEIDVYNGQTLNYQVTTRYDSVDLDPWKDGVVTTVLPKGFDYVEGSATSDGQAITSGVVFDEAKRELSFPKVTLDETNRENKISFDLKVKDATEGVEKIKVHGDAPIKKVIGNEVTLNVLAPKEGFVKVHYIDGETKEAIKDPYLITGLDNEPYEAKAETIAGYVLEEDKMPANRTGKIIAGETIDVTFSYRVGKLYISEVPDKINFKGKISSVDERYFFNKSEMKDSLIVTDERKNKSDWSVEVMISKELTGINTSNVLKNSLYYQTVNNDDILLNDQLQAVIKKEYQGANENIEHFNLSNNWSEDQEGFYLRVPGATVKKDEYHGELTWNLVDAP